MTRADAWRQFLILVVAGVLGSLAVIPYLLALQPPPGEHGPPPPIPLLVLSSALNETIQLAIAVGLGLAAARAVGLRAPISQALAEHGDLRAALDLPPCSLESATFPRPRRSSR